MWVQFQKFRNQGINIVKLKIGARLFFVIKLLKDQNVIKCNM